MHDSSARYPPPSCYPRTREEVQQIITDWVDDADAPERIMWLNGPAGAGKSAIAQSIAERYQDSRLAASFFFLRSSEDRGVADRLFMTLAWQLAFSIPETRPYIESVLKKEPLLYTKSIEVQFNRLIVDVFGSLLHDKPGLHPEKSLVIIDGVDECHSEQRQELFLTLIGNALSLRKISLRFLICSRPEPHIRETFDTETMKTVTHALMLDDSFDPNNDIQRYLKDELLRIFTKRQISSLPSDADIDPLVFRSSGQFIYASTVIKFVDDKDCNPRKQLDIILKLRAAHSSSPFAQLDLLYQQILSQQHDTRFLRDAFVLIIALGNPRVAFACRWLWICEEDLKLKLRRMHSLLHISDSYITTYHRSLDDFFLDKKRAGSYYIHPARVMLVQFLKSTHQSLKEDMVPGMRRLEVFIAEEAGSFILMLLTSVFTLAGFAPQSRLFVVLAPALVTFLAISLINKHAYQSPTRLPLALTLMTVLYTLPVLVPIPLFVLPMFGHYNEWKKRTERTKRPSYLSIVLVLASAITALCTFPALATMPFLVALKGNSTSDTSNLMVMVTMCTLVSLSPKSSLAVLACCELCAPLLLSIQF